MKKSLNRSLVTIALCIAFSSMSFAKNELQNLSSVELQWEDTPGAFGYEVEIFNSKDKKLKSFSSQKSLFQFKSTSGKLKIRGRVVDAYGKKGAWSALIDIIVPPDDIKFPENENKDPIKSKASEKTLKGTVKLVWPQGIQAKHYLVKVYDKENKVVQEKKVVTLSETFLLEVGDYKYSVTPIGNDQILGKEVMSSQAIQIGAAQLPTEKFEINKANNKLRILMPKRKDIKVIGELEYANHLSETWTPVTKYNPFLENAWSPESKLRPGRYRVGFWVSRLGWMDSEKFQYEFIIKPIEAEINE